MNADNNFVDRLMARSRSFAVPIYCAVVLTLTLVTLLSITNLVQRYDSYRDSSERLTQLENRQHPSMPINANAALRPPGSPFLEGDSATVASAMLLRRLTSAIIASGGTVVSSEIEQGGMQLKDGYVKATAAGELSHGALQQLLHDIEAGMPFLFIDLLAVQASSSSSDSKRLSVRLGVTGLWRGGK